MESVNPESIQENVQENPNDKDYKPFQKKSKKVKKLDDKEISTDQKSIIKKGMNTIELFI